MAKSKLTTNVRSLISEVANHNKITLRSYDARRELVKGTISADAPVRFTESALDYARGILSGVSGSQITVNDKKIIFSAKEWAHVAKNIALLEETSVKEPVTETKSRTGSPTGVPATGVPATGVPAKEVFTLNQQVEELIESKGKHRDDATAYSQQEKELLTAFAGYGGLEKYGEDKSGRGLLYEFYTPDQVVKVMWKLCVKYGYAGGSVLESSAGSGRFLRYAPPQADITAYEINPTTATILRVLYPQATVHNQPFERMFIGKNNNTLGGKVDHLRNFELAIGNPPYGKFESAEAAMGEKQYTRATNNIEYFIYRTLDVLRPGGLCCQLVGGEPATGALRFLQSGLSATKKKIMDMAELVEAHVLPEGVFDRSSSIGEIILLRKI